MSVRFNGGARHRSGREGAHSVLRAPLPPPLKITVLDLIAEHAAMIPDQVAIDDGNSTIRYGELWAQAGRVAGRLNGAGVAPGDPVIVWGPRSVGLAIALVGVLRAGGVVVPTPTALPAGRGVEVLAATGVRYRVCIGTPPPWLSGLDGLTLPTTGTIECPPLAGDTHTSPDDDAWIFFTSGTTGSPKIVRGNHASLAGLCTWWQQAFSVTSNDRVAMATSVNFVVTLRNLFAPLAAGATVCMAPDPLLPDHAFAWLADARISIVHLTPSIAESWLHATGPDHGRPVLRWTLFGGEPLTDRLVQAWRAATRGGGRVANVYGTTELGASRAWYVVPETPQPGIQPIGRGRPGTQLLVLDESGSLCRAGQTGELAIRAHDLPHRGDEVPEGYEHNPFSGLADDFLVHTGDLARAQADGDVILTGRAEDQDLPGRLDDQCKINGVRISPAEASHVLAEHPSVHQAVAMTFAVDGETRLGAVVVARRGASVDAAELRRHCGATLLAAAIPSHIVAADSLPLTVTGKLDRRAVLEILQQAAAGTHPSCRCDIDDDPGSEVLHGIVAIWRDLLGRTDIDAHSNFFEVGGSSIVAVRLGHRLHERFGHGIALHELLDAQTPAELARLLDGDAPRPNTTDRVTTEPTPSPDTAAPSSAHRRIAARALTHPDAPALTDGENTLTFAELDAQVRALAALLVECGVSPGSLVAIHARRHAALVPLLLAVHRAGAGYVPVDPDLPRARVEFLLDDCAPVLVVADRPLPASCTIPVLSLDACEATRRGSGPHTPDVTVADDPERTAYVIYTSGSTGNPKGVLVPHRALDSFVEAALEVYRFAPGDRLLQYHSFSFDTSVEEVFCTLAAGATLVMPTAPLLGSAGWFCEQLAALGITVLDIPTSFWTELVDDLAAMGDSLPPSVHTAIVGGSAVRAESVARWQSGDGARVRLCNAYGPTEVTIAATIADLTGASVEPGRPVSIGAPLRGVRALVVDGDDNEVADGEPGELLLGGAQLATGYLNRPELTAARFVVDPTGRTDARYYRTGDRVRRNPDGTFAFEARVDDQVKIRGYRVELGEIEAAFTSHPAVREAVAVLDGTDAAARIVMHLVMRDEHDTSVDELRAHAATVLPAYALPSSIERRASLPRTAGGKPDRRALRSSERGPLGFAQEQQWFLDQLDPGSSAYNLTVALRVRGALDLDTLDHALQVLVERHEALRTRYVPTEDGAGAMQVIDEPSSVVVEHVEVIPRAGEDLDAATRRTLFESGDVHFDLERGPLLRPAVITVGADDHIVALRTHHIAVDGWSTDVLIHDLLAAYDARHAGRFADLPPVGMRPVELARAERANAAQGSFDECITRWVNRLQGLPAPLPLPFDRPRPHTRDPQGEAIDIACPPGTADALATAARALRTTPFAVSLAIFGDYLATVCGVDDVVVGIPSADRDTPGSDRTVAMLVNTLPLRLRPDGRSSVRTSIDTTTRAVREAIVDKQAPFDRIVRALRPPRVPGLHPVYQVTFQTTPAPVPLGSIAGLEVEPYPCDRAGAKFDLSADLLMGAELTCRFTFARDVFSPATMHRLTEGYVSFLARALAALDEPVAAIARATGLQPVPVTVSAPEPAVSSPTAPGLAPGNALAAAPEGPERSAAAGPPAMADAVARIMGTVVGAPVGLDDDFFGAGGHSLLAVRLCSAIERELGARLSVATVFEAPTPRAIAHALDGTTPAPSDSAAGSGARSTPAPAVTGLAVTPAPAVAATPAIGPLASSQGAGAPTPSPRLARPARLWLRRAPMSFAQRRLWVIDQLGLAEGAYLLMSTHEMYGPLDLDRLRAAVRATADRHEVLRTRYVADAGGLAEQIIDAEPAVDIHLLDERDAAGSPAEIDARIRATATRPFNLAVDHPWRVVLARLDAAHHVLCLCVHHIATDGMSQGVIVRDLAEAYNSGGPADRPRPALQYADHAVWQHAQLASGALDDSIRWWRDRFTPVPDPLELPTARPRPAQVGVHGADVVVHAGSARAARVDAFARANGTTPFAVLLTAYHLLLHRVTDRHDITVGIPITERGLDDDIDTVGFFVNTVPVRVVLDATGSAGDALRGVQQSLAGAIEHATVPFDVLIDELGVPRDAATSPLVPTMFSLQDEPEAAPELTGLRSSRRAIDTGGTAKFDLTLLVTSGDSLELCFEYRTDVFDRTEVEAWSTQYLLLLDALLTDPGRPVHELPRLDASTERWLVDGCNHTTRAYPREATVIDLFDEVVERYGDRVAIVDHARESTYAELAAQAADVAGRLVDAGVRAGDRVALELGRSTELIVAMLGVLRCSAAYVPIDPSYPTARRSTMLDVAAVRAVVSLDGDSLLVTACGPDSHPAPAPEEPSTGATAPAYVMFTSGSTGTPKGVVVPHRGIVRLVRDTDYVDFRDDLVIAHLSNTSFDAATFEIWGALLNGARLVVLDTDTVTSPAAFAEAIRAHGITTMFVTTALFNVVAHEAPTAFAPLRHLLFGGEAADADAVRSVLAHGKPALLANVYGPTESTTFASWHPIERLAPNATAVPIGRPIANTTLHVVDAHGRPVPPLSPGELVIGGDGLALGYFGDDALTAARFVDDPFSPDPDGRLYRTGDIVRRRLDGAIEFVGRRDHQVKVRGFRIELGEIENALRALDGIAHAHVTTHRSERGDTAVLAYVVPEQRVALEALDTGALRNALRATLPAYMVPDAVLALAALPINPNGKIDRAALPVPSERVAPAVESAPLDPVETELRALWCEVLERTDVAIDDNFFELGGNSVRAVRLFAAVERRLDVRLALSTLFDAPTVRTLAAQVRERTPTSARRHGDPGTATPNTLRQAEHPSQHESIFVTLRPGTPNGGTPLYLIHPAGGHVLVYAQLLPALAADQTVVGIREHGWGDPSQTFDSIEAYAVQYADDIEGRQPRGPIALGGYSLGGLIAYEMARTLRARGRDVEVVVLLDALPDAPPDEPSSRMTLRSKLRRRATHHGVRGIVHGARRFVRYQAQERVVDPFVNASDRAHLALGRALGRPLDPLRLGRESMRIGKDLLARYAPGPYDGRVVLLRALGIDPDFPIPDDSPRWRRVASALEVIGVPGNHTDECSIMTPPYVETVGQELARLLAPTGPGKARSAPMTAWTCPTVRA